MLLHVCHFSFPSVRSYNGVGQQWQPRYDWRNTVKSWAICTASSHLALGCQVLSVFLALFVPALAHHWLWVKVRVLRNFYLKSTEHPGRPWAFILLKVQRPWGSLCPLGFVRTASHYLGKDETAESERALRRGSLELRAGVVEAVGGHVSTWGPLLSSGRALTGSGGHLPTPACTSSTTNSHPTLTCPRWECFWPHFLGCIWTVWAHPPQCGWFQRRLFTTFSPVLWGEICSGTSEKDPFSLRNWLLKSPPLVLPLDVGLRAWQSPYPLETMRGKLQGTGKTLQNTARRERCWLLDGTIELLNWQTLKLVLTLRFLFYSTYILDCLGVGGCLFVCY